MFEANPRKYSDNTNLTKMKSENNFVSCYNSNEVSMLSMADFRRNYYQNSNNLSTNDISNSGMALQF